MRLSELQTGQKGYITNVYGSGAFRKRLLEMGFVRGEEVKSILNAPLKDPIKYEIMEYEVSLRRSEAVMIEITMLESDISKQAHQTREELLVDGYFENSHEVSEKVEAAALPNCKVSEATHQPENKIKVALVGNPNSGKISVFNLA